MAALPDYAYGPRHVIKKCIADLEELDLPPWEHSARSSYRLRTEILELLTVLSGDCLSDMLREVIPVNILREMPHGVALEALAEPFNEMAGGVRRPLLIAFKHSRTEGGVDRQELMRLGYQIQEETYSACDKPKMHKDSITGGRHSKGKALEPKIKDLLTSSSAPINRGIVEGRKRARSAPRRLDYTYRELYERFEDNDNISYRTFLRHCGSEFLSYSLPTDCCDFCVAGRKSEKAMQQLRTRYREFHTSLADLVLKYADQPNHPLYIHATTLMECDEHRHHKKIQRTVYNRHTNLLAPGEVTIELDWRRKGHLPLQSSQTGGAWYQHTQYALLGVAVYWCGDSGETRHHSVDVLSNSITEDSHCSLEGLRTALREILKNEAVPCDLVGAKKIHFWSDTGPHFRSHEYIHYVLKEFPAWLGNRDVRIDLNYLTEKHGKNQRDSHFRCVRSYTMRAARDSKSTIGTCSMLRDALARAHGAVQQYNKSAKLPLQSCEFYYLGLSAKGTYQKKCMQVADLCSTYALRMDPNNTLWAYTDSTYKHRVEMPYSCSSYKVPYETSIPASTPLASPTKLTQMLKRRRSRKSRLFEDAETCDGSEPDVDP